MELKNVQSKIKLANGHEIPCMGFGTYKIPDGDDARECVRYAINAGYRHIDAAAFYMNEKSVGEGIELGMADQGLSREDIFITSKVWPSNAGYEKSIASVNKSLEDLGLDYLDLILIHWPADAHNHPDWVELNLSSWKAFTELYKQGKAKAIGTSNFWIKHLDALMKTEIKPMVNQLEFHPAYMQKEVVDFCQSNDIVVEAWSPLGRSQMLKDPLIMSLAEKYKKSEAQICLRWVLQNGVVPLVKSVNKGRIKNNMDCFDFEIEKSDMEKIAELPEFLCSGHTPENVNYG